MQKSIRFSWVVLGVIVGYVVMAGTGYAQSVTLNSISATPPYLAVGTAAGGEGITERGFFWWTLSDSSGLLPATGTGPGSFSLYLTGLLPQTQYSVKAYIKAKGQIFTSAEYLLTTAASTNRAPTVVTTGCRLNADNTVFAGGEITDIGSSAVNVYGVAYATHPAPDTGDQMLALWNNTPVNSPISFSVTIRNLTPGQWYLRAYAHNGNSDSSAAQIESRGYGADCAFVIPGVRIDSVLAVSPYTVTATAFGEGVTERGFRWWTSSSSDLLPTGEIGSGTFSLNLTGLKPGKSYHVQAYIKIDGMTITSPEYVFTAVTPPTVETKRCQVKADNSVVLSGRLLASGSSSVQEYGFVYANHPAPSAATPDSVVKVGRLGGLSLSFSQTISKLPFGQWYVRAYARNQNADSSAEQLESLGYGADCAFSIMPPPTVATPLILDGLPVVPTLPSGVVHPPVVVPTPQPQCFGTGASCTADAECCSGGCMQNVCQ